jgi:hypothetical protein
MKSKLMVLSYYEVQNAPETNLNFEQKADIT